MSKWKQGDTVEIVRRPQTPDDVKSGLYYRHFAGLTGTILKIYGEEASVLIDRTALPVEIRQRHEENEKAMRQKWLDGLSEEGRNRLTAAEKAFTLHYALLVSAHDLSRATPRPAGETDPKRATGRDLDAAEAAFLAERNRRN